MPQGSAHYARVQLERVVWGPTLEYEAFLKAFYKMIDTLQPWASWDGVENIGMEGDYV